VISKVNRSTMTGVEPIFDIAFTVADALVREYAAGNTPIPAVDPATFHALRAVIPIRPAYAGRPAWSGGSCVHNG
jgi:hypothetical protein